ncbi:hypothetical protein BCR36DRAFT_341439 [Piromyces finnis]|uniref:Uncharacterized protein n=1 Tax=Piromyces finnis TaxID=1754191 RepID=A0A1Y1VPS7_9FUNG|nr:hypothetical protein BCR36DRAFT_341439 [Piromyces finnis]|eukprot:ORX61133.1 hypothetical protein BCR36DRAFT_341439 [Piromyces finnis]
MDIDCEWCICGKKTTNGRLYCSEECKLSDCTSDSSTNSDYSPLSNHSPNFIPKFYSTSSKKMNKNYIQIMKGGNNKTMTHNYNYNYINGSVHKKSSFQNKISNSSPMNQNQIPLKTKYNQTDLMKSYSGLITSPIIGMNMNTTVVTTHVNTSGHIIQASSSAPKITEMDPSMIPSTNMYYNRRYSLPIGHSHQISIGANTLNHILVNVNVPDENHISLNNLEEDKVLISTSSHLPSKCENAITTNNSDSKHQKDDNKALYSEQSTNYKNNINSLEKTSYPMNPHSSVTKIIKNNPKVIVSQSDTTNTTFKNSGGISSMISSNSTHENSYTLYKTSASTNLCALNNTSNNILLKNRSNYNFKLMNSGIKLKSNSIESVVSNTTVTPIYF